jgi:DNA-binding transcriptional MerR regulator
MNRTDASHRIGDVSQLTGLSPRAIRYYEELGLIRASRSNGGFRLYSARDIDILKVVLQFKDLGMSLEDIRGLVAPGTAEPPHEVVKRLQQALHLRRGEFETKIEKYQKGIEQIDQALALLAACASCARPSEGESCSACIKHRGDEPSPLLESLLEGKPF